MTVSVLDGVPGLGETRRKALLKYFGSVRKLREATAQDLARVPGVGPATAAAIVDALAGKVDAATVSAATDSSLMT